MIFHSTGAKGRVETFHKKRVSAAVVVVELICLCLSLCRTCMPNCFRLLCLHHRWAAWVGDSSLLRQWVWGCRLCKLMVCHPWVGTRILYAGLFLLEWMSCHDNWGNFGKSWIWDSHFFQCGACIFFHFLQCGASLPFFSPAVMMLMLVFYL